MEHPHETGKKASDAKSVSKTLAILSTFDERTPMQRTSDIAARLGMNISTVSRHLNTLLDWGFLRRDDETDAIILEHRSYPLQVQLCRTAMCIVIHFRNYSFFHSAMVYTAI